MKYGQFNINILLLLFAIAAMSVVGCAPVQPILVRSVQCCEFKKEHGTDPAISFDLELENPNEFEISVQKYELSVKINGNIIGTMNSNEAMVLGARSVLSKNISIQTSTQQLISGTLLMGLNSLFKKDMTTLEAEIFGCVVGKAKGVPIRLKVREKYPIQMHP